MPSTRAACGTDSPPSMLFDTKTIGGIYTVSKLLGHSMVAVTEMCLHCSQKQLEQAMLAGPLGAGV